MAAAGARARAGSAAAAAGTRARADAVVAGNVRWSMRVEGKREAVGWGSWIGLTDGGLSRYPGLGLDGEVWRPYHFRALSREPAGVDFLDFIL